MIRYISFFFLVMIQLATLASTPDWQKIESQFNKEKPRFRTIDDLAAYLKNHYPDDKQGAAALYWWLGNHITYDMAAYRNNSRSRIESQSEITSHTFAQRKGVCEGYAGIMDSVLQILNIPSYIIGGYTRQGQNISPVPHAWVAARIGGEWRLFDPTWAAGSLVGRKFEKRFDPAFFMIEPEQMRLTHMPYDPIWQFSHQIVSHQEFITQQQAINTAQKPHFAYLDSIAAFNALETSFQLLDEYNRILRYYYPHKAVNTRLEFLSENLEITRYNQEVNLLNQATTSYNNAVDAYNEWVNWRQQNGPRNTQGSDQLLLNAGQHLSKSLEILSQLQQASRELDKGIKSLGKAAESLKKQMENAGLRFE